MPRPETAAVLERPARERPLPCARYSRPATALAAAHSRQYAHGQPLGNVRRPRAGDMGQVRCAIRAELCRLLGLQRASIWLPSAGNFIVSVGIGRAVTDTDT
jgi:hypothetical protein